VVLSTNILWTEYRYRDVVSNGLLFLMDGFVYVILTGLVFRLLLDADPKHAKIPQIRIEIHVGSVERPRIYSPNHNCPRSDSH
jgi:hypothetical protein